MTFGWNFAKQTFTKKEGMFLMLRIPIFYSISKALKGLKTLTLHLHKPLSIIRIARWSGQMYAWIEFRKIFSIGIYFSSFYFPCDTCTSSENYTWWIRTCYEESYVEYHTEVEVIGLLFQQGFMPKSRINFTLPRKTNHEANRGSLLIQST